MAGYDCWDALRKELGREPTDDDMSRLVGLVEVAPDGLRARKNFNHTVEEIAGKDPAALQKAVAALVEERKGAESAREESALGRNVRIAASVLVLVAAWGVALGAWPALLAGVFCGGLMSCFYTLYRARRSQAVRNALRKAERERKGILEKANLLAQQIKEGAERQVELDKRHLDNVREAHDRAKERYEESKKKYDELVANWGQQKEEEARSHRTAMIDRVVKSLEERPEKWAFDGSYWPPRMYAEEVVIHVHSSQNGGVWLDKPFEMRFDKVQDARFRAALLAMRMGEKLPKSDKDAMREDGPSKPPRIQPQKIQEGQTGMSISGDAGSI